MNISKLLQRKTKEIAAGLSKVDIFNSPEFKEFYDNMLHSVLIGQSNIKINMEYNPANNNVAYTDGNLIYINSGNDISNSYSTINNNIIALLGIGFHECAHNLFLDIEKENEIIQDISNGKFLGEFEAVSDKEEEYIKDIKEKAQNPDFSNIFKYIYHSLSNIFSDVHDEDRICRKFHGIVEKGITFSAEAMHSQSLSIETLMKKLNAKEIDEEIDELSIMFSLILQFARYGSITIEDDSKSNEFIEKLMDIASVISNGCLTDDVKEKYTAINRCVLTLWEYIDKMLKEHENQQQQQQQQQNQSNSQSQGQNQSQNNGQGSGSEEQNSNSSQTQNQQSQSQQSSQNSQQAAQKIESSLKKGEKTSGVKNNAPMPQNQPSKKNKKKASNKASATNQGKKQEISNEEADKIIQNALNNIVHQIAQAQAEKELEEAINNEGNIIIETVDMSSTHKGMKTHIIRNNDVTSTDINNYNAYMKTLAPISKKLQRQMENALKDLKDGAVQKHKLFGRKIEASDSYRLDGRCFSNKKQPQDLPDMAISLLIDQSGSMSGQRIEATKKAAMLVYDFAVGLNIPIMIAGHCAKDYDGIEYCPYTNFDRVGNKDKYRLNHIKAYSACNRDGMAINISADSLSRRPEDIKLLIIISDGQPNHGCYGGESAEKDIQEIVRKYKKKGVETIAAAIGDDKDRIKEIYREGYLDITDISTLPKTLVKLVKKRIVR